MLQRDQVEHTQILEPPSIWRASFRIVSPVLMANIIKTYSSLINLKVRARQILDNKAYIPRQIEH